MPQVALKMMETLKVETLKVETPMVQAILFLPQESQVKMMITT